MNLRFFMAIFLSLAIFIIWTFAGRYFGLIREVAVPQAQEQAELLEGTPTPAQEQPAQAEVTDQAAPVVEPTEPPPERQTLVLGNDQLQLEIDNLGGGIHSATLKHYFQKSGATDPVQLINAAAYFPGQLEAVDGRNDLKTIYRVEKQNERELVLSGTTPFGKVEKTYRLGESFDLFFKVNNLDPAPYYVIVAEGLQPLQHDEAAAPSFLSFGAIPPKYMHITWSIDGSENSHLVEELERQSLAPLVKEPKPIEWAGVRDGYFANVLMPDWAADNVFVRGVDRTVDPLAEPIKLPIIALKATRQVEGTFYMGPMNESLLSKVSPKLNNLINYGWAGLLSKALLAALAYVHGLFGNWGWAIVVLTILIRAVLLPLAIPSVRSSFKMRKIQPKMDKLKQKYPGDDFETKAKMNQEMMALYREEGVNPFASCLTLLPQMPVFFSYFSVLRTSIDLRQADGILWITDLSSKDPTYLLPIIMAVSMYVSSQSMAMPNMDPTQQKMMKIMPLMFSVFMIAMPSGLVLYMVVSNFFTMGQTYLLKRYYEKKFGAPA